MEVIEVDDDDAEDQVLPASAACRGTCRLPRQGAQASGMHMQRWSAHRLPAAGCASDHEAPGWSPAARGSADKKLGWLLPACATPSLAVPLGTHPCNGHGANAGRAVQAEKDARQVARAALRQLNEALEAKRNTNRHILENTVVEALGKARPTSVQELAGLHISKFSANTRDIYGAQIVSTLAQVRSGHTSRWHL